KSVLAAIGSSSITSSCELQLGMRGCILTSSGCSHQGTTNDRQGTGQVTTN
ncbi:unnamed protein product, partial (mitochondrion) [Musa banksii]